MPRQVRIELPGAFYHVMCRGDRREAIFEDDDDRNTFLRTLGQAAGRTGWRIHAYVLMDNHYHLLLQTPEPNLVKGMTWFQTTYTVRYNAHHRTSGHLFGGRYKAVLVDEDERSGIGGGYLGTLLDYIHLNPVRAGITKVTPEAPSDLLSYPWSSLPSYAGRPSLRPGFLETADAYDLFGLKDGPRGRKDFVGRLAKRALDEKRQRCGLSEIQGQSLQSTLRRGWCYGSAAFKERMLEIAEAALEKRSSGKSGSNYRGEELRDHAEKKATAILTRGLKIFDLRKCDLPSMSKGAPAKAAIAERIRSGTSVSLAWITNKLAMGSTANVGRACARLAEAKRKDPDLRKRAARLLSDFPS